MTGRAVNSLFARLPWRAHIAFQLNCQSLLRQNTMFLTQVTFGTDGGGQTRESLCDTAEWYLATLLHNGQICGDYLFAWGGGRLVTYTHVARPDAFAARHHSQGGRSALKDVIGALGRAPEWHILEDDIPRRFPSWRRSSSLYLFTHAFDDASPVWCGDTGSAIPTYLLPIPERSREDLYFWARWYRDHDNVWLGSGALEIPAYRQLADPRSELSAGGRESCKEIEAATGKPAYYYVMRYWGRTLGEQDRLCPLCGRKWRTQHSTTEKQPFQNFHFRCTRCRLVSHCAASSDDQRHARIGEYPRKARSQGVSDST